jgi:hypothetical protein
VYIAIDVRLEPSDMVYFPVWIDKFGGEKATTWITLLQIGVPLGIFAGYGMTSVIVQTGLVT